MRNNAKKLFPLLLTFIMLLSLSVTASAAAAKKISITGSLKTMVVGQKNELDTKITPKNAKVREYCVDQQQPESNPDSGKLRR